MGIIQEWSDTQIIVMIPPFNWNEKKSASSGPLRICTNEPTYRGEAQHDFTVTFSYPGRNWSGIYPIIIDYKINLDGAPEGAVGAIDAAAATWNAASENKIYLKNDGTTNKKWNPDDNINAIYWGPLDLGWDARCYPYYTSNNENIIGCDQAFNDQYLWGIDGSPNVLDIQSVATHEFGHWLMLADLYGEADAEKVMYGGGQYSVPVKRSLAQDDIDGIRYIYRPHPVTTLWYISCWSSSATLYWISPGDEVSQYDVRYSEELITEENWDSAIQVTGEPDPLPAGSFQSMTVGGLDPNHYDYYFAIKTSDETSNLSEISNFWGDVNNNGSVDMGDVVLVARIIRGLSDWTIRGDVNLDGRVNAADITQIERIIMGLDWLGDLSISMEKSLSNPAAVSVEAPTLVNIGSDFTVNVNVDNVTILDAENFNVSFDPAVLRLDNVTHGLIGTTPIPVSGYSERSPGNFTIVQNLSGVSGVTGSGTLAVLHFHVLGTAGQTSDITLSSGCLSNGEAEEIIADWGSDTVTVAPIGSLDINNGDNITGSLFVTLNLSASDPVGITSYRIANGPDASGESTTSISSTTSFSDIVSWTLTPSEGEKTVAVQYRNADGNWSLNYTDNITFKLPTVVIYISNGGNGPDNTPPAAIPDLAISSSTSHSVTLSWTAQGDDGTIGTAAAYDIRYSTEAITAGNWDNATQVNGEPTPQAAGTGQNYEVSVLNSDTTYYFAIKTADEIPNLSDISNLPEGATSVDTTPPAAASNLAAGSAAYNSITLTWTAPGDDGAIGTAASYDIRYSTSAITEGNWDNATQVNGEPTPQASGTGQNCVVSDLDPNTTYYFALKTADEESNRSEISNIPTSTTLALPVVIIYIEPD